MQPEALKQCEQKSISTWTFDSKLLTQHQGDPDSFITQS